MRLNKSTKGRALQRQSPIKWSKLNIPPLLLLDIMAASTETLTAF